MEEIGKRVQKLLELKGVTPYEASIETGLSQATFSRIITKNSRPNLANSKLLADYFNVSRQYLMTGETLQVDSSLSVVDEKELIPNKNGNVYEEIGDGKFKIYVKKVPVKAFGSYLSCSDNPDFFDDLKQVSFTVDHIGKGNYICFEVQGDSMNGGGINDAPEGAELLCRELGKQHWKDGFRDCDYGWVIVHKETVLYKDITSLNKETGDIVCHSRSGLPQHPDFTINLNEVRQIWKVIKRSF